LENYIVFAFYQLKPILLFLCFLFGFTGLVSASAPGNPCGGIGGTIRSQDLTIPQRGGGTLNAKIFAPDAALQTATCPAISMLPGGGAEISSVEWAAQRLAANGYVVIITKPQSGGSLDSYNTAVRSGIDFLISNANPYLSSTDTDAIGAAGWSLGARVLSRTQEEDTRISAIVGWDNLAVSEAGDTGSPQCTNQPTTLRIPRVPALGQASDTCIDGRNADAKTAAFNRWREFGQPVVQVVFRGSNHFWWSAAASDAQHNLTHYYTQNWFDRWLKGDLTATARLVSRTVNNVSLDNILSSNFRSGVTLDGYNCEDFRAGCQISTQKATISGRITDTQGRGIPRARIVLTGDNLASPIYLMTNPFGYFRFVNVPVNWNYRATVSAKNRNFPIATVSLIPTNDVANLNFVSSP
jgi:hypothetical protein